MKKSTLKAVAAVSVFGAIAIGLGAVSSWYTNWNTSTWFGRGGNKSTVQTVTPDTDSAVDCAVLTDGENNGISLMTAKLPRAAYAANGISEQADTAYLLTAIVEPENTTYKACDWTVEWKNADSAWAKNKTVTDYVTVIPTEDGALTANVVCNQAFGEQVIITVTNRETPSVYSTVNCDYIARVVGVEVGMDEDAVSFWSSFGFVFDNYLCTLTDGQCYDTSLASYYSLLTPLYSPYTIQNIATVSIECRFYTEWDENGNHISSGRGMFCGFNPASLDTTYTVANMSTEPCVIEWNIKRSNLTAMGVYENSIDMFATFLSGGCMYFYITAENSVSTLETSIRLMPDASLYDVSATGLTTDKTEIEF